jgi:hypothetical protein
MTTEGLGLTSLEANNAWSNNYFMDCVER